MNNFTKIVNDLNLRLKTLPKRKETLVKCIQDKLLHSEDMYNEQIQEAYKYLLSRDNLKVLKTIARENKKKGV